jgi:hypothetical protein
MTANLRIFLWALLGMALFVNYQTWMRANGRRAGHGRQPG